MRYKNENPAHISVYLLRLVVINRLSHLPTTARSFGSGARHRIRIIKLYIIIAFDKSFTLKTLAIATQFR